MFLEPDARGSMFSLLPRPRVSSSSTHRGCCWTLAVDGLDFLSFRLAFPSSSVFPTQASSILLPSLLSSFTPSFPFFLHSTPSPLPYLHRFIYSSLSFTFLSSLPLFPNFPLFLPSSSRLPSNSNKISSSFLQHIEFFWERHQCLPNVGSAFYVMAKPRSSDNTFLRSYRSRIYNFHEQSFVCFHHFGPVNYH